MKVRVEYDELEYITKNTKENKTELEIEINTIEIGPRSGTNRFGHHICTMYNSVLIANYWYNKIKKIKLCGYLPQNKSYINTFNDNNFFNIECKCEIHSSGELLVDNI